MRSEIFQLFAKYPTTYTLFVLCNVWMSDHLCAGVYNFSKVFTGLHNFFIMLITCHNRAPITENSVIRQAIRKENIVLCNTKKPRLSLPLKKKKDSKIFHVGLYIHVVNIIKASSIKAYI